MTSSVSQLLSTRLALFNTATHQVDRFTPADGERVLMYVCGPTVYSTPHIGNMRTYLFSDLLRRTLALTGWEVDAAMNITDVGHLTSDADSGEDKLAAAAAAERITAWEVAARYTEEFFADTDQLNITPFQHVLKATDHLPEQIELVQRLEDKGVLYTTADGVYLDTSQVPDYGKLTPNDDRTHLRAGERVALGEKRHPTDFAVWKYADDAEGRRDMEWDSPWGRGFPGWHLECSAMAMSALGETLDLHLGGIDHIAIHHTNEIAQSETVTGVEFSRWWMHGAFLTLEGEARMGKSVGNKITLDDVVGWGFTPLELRYLVLGSHYRSPLEFSEDILRSNAVAYRRLLKHVEAWQETGGPVPDPADVEAHPYAQDFFTALADDLNAPRALAVLWSLARDPDVEPALKLALVGLFDQVLGLDLLAGPGTSAEAPDDVVRLAEERSRARAAKDFAASDRLRDEIRDLGWVVSDSRDGYELTPAG